MLAPRLRAHPARRRHARPRRLRDGRADPRARALARHADHLPDGELPQRRARLPRLLGRRRRLPLQAVHARRSCSRRSRCSSSCSHKREALKRQTAGAAARARRARGPGPRAHARARRPPTASLRAEIVERVRDRSGARRRCSSASRRARVDAEAVNRMKDEFLGHAVARAAHAAQRDPRLGAPADHRARRDDATIAARHRRHPQQRAWRRRSSIEDILDVSRIISGKLRLNLAPCRLRDVIEAALDSVAPAADAKGIAIARELDDVDADHRRPGSAPAGVLEPAVERRQVHAARRPRHASA